MILDQTAHPWGLLSWTGSSQRKWTKPGGTVMNHIFDSGRPGEVKADYWQGSLGYSVVGVQLQVSFEITRDHLYLDPGYGVGTPGPSVSFGPGKVVGDGPLTQKQVDDYVQGPTLKAGGQLGGGAYFAWGNEGKYRPGDAGFEWAIGSPSASLVQSCAFQVG